MAKTHRHARAESAQRFRALVHEAVTPDDVLAICHMLAGAARQGNVIAAKLLFNYLVGPPSVPPPALLEGSGAPIGIPALAESEPDREPGRAVPANELATGTISASANP